MAGIVWEWVNGWCYYSVSPYSNPTGPDNGTNKVLRGGAWSYDSVRYLRVAYRNDNYHDSSIYFFGFYCAVSTPGE
jgi:formylglycine-generating enzyme required for sulfatase activity